MNCPHCGNPAQSIGTMQVTTKEGKIIPAEVFKCQTCTQQVPYPEEGTIWPLEFANVGGETSILRPPASEFN